MVYTTCIKDYHLLFATIVVKDPKIFLNDAKILYKDAIIQLADLNSIVDEEHVEEIVKQSLEAMERGIMIADHVDMEILLRLACTNQIDTALRFAGAKPDTLSVIIVLSKDKDVINKIGLHLNLNALSSSQERNQRLMMYHAITNDMLNTIKDNKLALLLAEKANLIH